MFRVFFRNAPDPFIIELAGQKLVVLTSAEHVAAMYKNTTDLSFNGLVKMIHKGVANVSLQGFEILWRTPGEGFESLHPNPKEQVLVHTGNALLHKQVLPGVLLEQLTARFLRHVESTTRWNTFFPTSVLAESRNGSERVVSLHRWTLEVLVDAATRAFFGEALPKQLPSISSVFDEWDMNSYMSTYQYPDFLSQAAIVPRDKIIVALTKYLDLPKEERNDAAPFVYELEEEQRHAGLSNADAARIFMIIYWGWG